MTKLRCCFCQQELVREGSDNYWCKKCNLERDNPALYGSQKLWQELIRTKKQLETTDLELDQLNLEKYDIEDELERTRKALDVARHTIGWINQMIDEHTDKQAIKIKCEYALQQITALEQKE